MGPPAELRLAALALLVGVVGCVGPEAGDPPGGAVEVDAPMSGAESTDGFPFAVATRWVAGDYGEVLCSGALVERDWVITTAHCVPDDWRAPESEVLVGANYSTPDQALPIVDAVIHPVRSETGTWSAGYPDLALVRLDGCAEAPPLAIPAEPVLGPADVGEALWIAGFGRFDDAEPPDGLKRAGEFVTTRVDQRYLAYVGVDGVETGLGDSGAPVLWSGGAGLELVAVHRGERDDWEGSRVDMLDKWPQLWTAETDCEPPPDDDTGSGCACRLAAAAGAGAGPWCSAVLLLYWRMRRARR